MLAVAGLLLLAGGQARAVEPAVQVIEVRGLLDPAVDSFLRSSLARAGGAGTQVVVLALDSPGALSVDVPGLVEAVEDAPVPVVAWLAPRGARATSGAFAVALAADALYVSQGAVLGDAARLDLAGPDPSGQAVARLLTGLAPAPGRELALRAASGEIFPGSAAVEAGLAQGSAASPAELLQALDGTPVGGRTLDTWDPSAGAPAAPLRVHDMGLLETLLHAVTSPGMALMLLLVGAYGLIFELYNPGIGLAAAVGVVCLALGVYAVDVLPANWWGLLVVFAGVGLLVYDVQTSGLGPPSLAGVALVGLGGLLTFAGAPEAVSLSWVALVLALVVTVVFFISVITAALRVRLRRPVSEDDELIGTIGEAQTDIAPEGTVLTKGTLWRARTMETGIAAGSKVQVKATEGFVLLVEPFEEHGPGPD